MNEDNKKNEYITSEDLDKKLDDRFGEQTQVLLTAFDKRFNQMEEKESKLEKKIDKIQTSIDGYVKEQEDFKEEFVIVKEEGKQMKQVFKDKLGVEIRVI